MSTDKNTSSKTYNIFLDMALRDPRQSKCKETSVEKDRLEDPDYYGYLAQQRAGGLLTYFPCGKKELSFDEVEQLIEQING